MRHVPLIRSRFVSLAAAAMMAVALAAGALLFAGTGAGLAQGAASVEQLMAEGPLPDIALGPKDAPITIIEYASMTCPHCAHFHETTYPVLRSKYIEPGKVRFILREFPLDPPATAAFMLAANGAIFPKSPTLKLLICLLTLPPYSPQLTGNT